MLCDDAIDDGLLTENPSSRCVIVVLGTAFTEMYGIDTSVARRYRARDLGDGILGFGLEDASVEAGRGRPA